MKPFLPGETPIEYTRRIHLERKQELDALSPDLRDDLKQVTLLCVKHDLISESRGREILAMYPLDMRRELMAMEDE